MGSHGGKGKNERVLTPAEIAFVRSVFKGARLPSFTSQITIADGVNGNGGAWTDSDYQINVGPFLYAQKDVLGNTDSKGTLVHEMTHVWQYYNGTLTKAHAGAAQALYWFARRTDYLYDYDFEQSWDDMGFEGQAQLVEDWFTNDHLSPGSRYAFVSRILHQNDAKARTLTLAQMEEREEIKKAWEGSPATIGPHTSSARNSRPPLTDALLVEILARRYNASDVAGYGARVKRLEGLFRSTSIAEALVLYNRLILKASADKVAFYFHSNLSTPTRNNLLQILKMRLAGK